MPGRTQDYSQEERGGAAENRPGVSAVGAVRGGAGDGTWERL